MHRFFRLQSKDHLEKKIFHWSFAKVSELTLISERFFLKFWGILRANRIKVNLQRSNSESRHISLFVVSGFIRKLFLIDYVNIYFSQSIVFANICLFSIFFSIDFAR